MRISALQPNTSCQVRELNSGEVRYNQVLSPRLKDVFVSVKGPFNVKSNAIENLEVAIDGIPYLVGDLRGTQMATFPDPDTAPPPVPVTPVKGGTTKPPAVKTAPRSR